MNVLILEDETLAAERLQTLIKEVDPDFSVVNIIKTVEGSVMWLNDNPHPDLILSDIKLLDGLSFEIFKKVEVNTPVIFTTAYDQYAIKAFEANSIDYLLKPIQKEKLRASIDKFKRLSSGENSIQAYEHLKAMIEAQGIHYKTRFMIRNGQKILALSVDKIAYFFSQNKLTYVVTSENKRYAYDQPLEAIDQQLDPRVFFRANRKYLVRFEAIQEIHPHFKGRMKINLQPSADDEVIISSEKTPEFKQWLDQ